MKPIMVSPMQDIPPPPCLVASTLELQLGCSQAVPALQLPLGEIIIKINVIPPEATAVAKQCMLGLPIWEPQVPEAVVCAAGRHGP